ncbi:MAG: alpha/beta hydrolase [Clostridiales bacterium]|nr:alpha/beta hydrolase [Clostridiales bacterium]
MKKRQQRSPPFDAPFIKFTERVYTAMLTALIIIICIYVAVPVVLVLNMEFLLRVRGRKAKSTILEYPKDLEIEEEFIQVQEGVKLQSWWIGSWVPTKNTIIFIHGNARNITYFSDFFRKMHRNVRANLCAVSLRGYGKSGGKLSFKKVIPDLIKTVSHIKRHRHITPEDIIIHGRSQGASIAAELVSGLNVKGLIIESGLATLNDLIGGTLKKTKLFFPFAYLNMARLKSGRFNTFKNLKRITCPVLLIHGKQDRQVPVRCALRNHSANKNCRLLLIDGAGHQNCSDSPRYYEAINDTFGL